MLARIRETLIIATLYDLPEFRHPLGDGLNYGVHFEYAEHPSPDSLAQAFIIAEKLIQMCINNIYHKNRFSMWKGRKCT